MRECVEARLWRALQEVEDPEIPISVVGMGLIVSLAYREDERAVQDTLHRANISSPRKIPCFFELPISNGLICQPNDLFINRGLNIFDLLARPDQR